MDRQKRRRAFPADKDKSTARGMVVRDFMDTVRSCAGTMAGVASSIDAVRHEESPMNALHDEEDR